MDTSVHKPNYKVNVLLGTFFSALQAVKCCSLFICKISTAYGHRVLNYLEENISSENNSS